MFWDMKKNGLLFGFLLYSFTLFSQSSNHVFYDSLDKLVPSVYQILGTENYNQFWKSINIVSPIIDSIYIELNNKIKNTNLNVVENSIKYESNNILDLIGSRLLDTQHTRTINSLIDVVAPTEQVISNLSDKEIQTIKLNKFIEEEFKIFDTLLNQNFEISSFIIQAKKIDSINQKVFEIDTLASLDNSISFMDMVINFKNNDESNEQKNGQTIIVYMNRVLNSFSQSMENTYSLISNKEIKLELDYKMAKINYKLDRFDLALEWLTRFVGDISKTEPCDSWKQAYFTNQVIMLLDKVTRMNPELRISLFYDMISDFPSPKDCQLLQYYLTFIKYAYSDYYTYVPFLNNGRERMSILSEATRLRDAISSLRYYYCVKLDIDTSAQLLPLLNIGANYPVIVNRTGDSIPFCGVNIFYLLKKTELDPLYSDEGLYEIFDQYLLQLLNRNEIEKAFGFYITFIKTRKLIRSTPYFFNELLYNYKLQDEIYRNESSLFQSFISEFEKLMIDPTIIKSNIQILWRDYDKVVANYYSYKPANSQKEYDLFQDSSNFYYRHVYTWDKEINTLLSEGAKEIAMYDLNNEIEDISRKRDSMFKEFNRIVKEFNIQIVSNLRLVDSNKKLKISNDELSKAFNRMKMDTSKLGSKLRILQSENKNLASQNSNLVNFNDSLKKINANINSKNNRLKIQNTTLSTTRYFLIAVSLFLTISSLILYFLRRKLRRETKDMRSTIKANKRANNIEILLRNLNDHDIDNAYAQLHSRVLNGNMVNIDEMAFELNTINTFADSFRYYKNQYKNKRIVSHISTVGKELQLLKLYVPMFTGMYHSKHFNIQLVEDIADELYSIPIPFKMIHNIVINSIKHGLKHKDKIKIIISGKSNNDRLDFNISDNGDATNFNILDLKGGGYTLITDLINQFNNEPSNFYTIFFEPTSQFIYSNSFGGLTVKFYLSKK